MPNAQYFSIRGCALSVAMPQALRRRWLLSVAEVSVQVPHPQFPIPVNRKLIVSLGAIKYA